MFINSTKVPLEFSRLLTKKSGNELKKFKICIAWSTLEWKPDEQQATSIMFFFFFYYFYSTLNKLRDLLSLLFFQIKCGPSIRIFFVFRLLFEGIYQSLQYGEKEADGMWITGKNNSAESIWYAKLKLFPVFRC